MAFRLQERLLTVVLIALIAIWGALTWMIQPLWDDLQAMRVQVDAKQQQLVKVKDLVQEASSVELAYRSIEDYVVGAASPRDLLDELQTLASTLGLQLDFKPRGAYSEDGVERFEVECEVQGPQADLLSFVDALIRLPKLLRVERMRLTNAPTREHLLRANLVLHYLRLT